MNSAEGGYGIRILIKSEGWEGCADMRLKTQLVVSFMIIYLGLTVLSSTIIYKCVFDILKERTEKSTMQQFRQAEYNIRSFRGEIDRISKMLLVDDYIQEFIEYAHISQLEHIRLYLGVMDKIREILYNYSYIESIYVLTEDGEIIGGTSSKNGNLKSDGKQHKLYHTEAYMLASRRYPELVWTGGYETKDFDIYSYNNTVEHGNRLISASRAIKSIYQGKQCGTVIINIEERAIASIYNDFSEYSSGMYIINDEGEIISHTDTNSIGTVSGVNGKINKAGSSSGSFVEKQDSISKQVVYLRLDNMGWTLVNEIPLDEYISDISRIRKIVFLIIAVSLAAAFLLSTYWIYKIISPLKKLTEVMRRMEKGTLGLVLHEVPDNELGILIRQFNKMSRSIVELVRQNDIVQEEKRKREIEILQAQINPHFLYNTLNTIKWMATVANADNIAECLTTLGRIIRPAFSSTSVLCTVEEEIDYIYNYIKIMNYRYGEGINVRINIPEKILKCKILRFILQPLIENAFKHGMNNSYTGEICIEGIEQNDDILVCVSDSGEGMDEDKVEELMAYIYGSTGGSDEAEYGIGLVNVNRRIRLNFGEKYGISIESSQGKGTKVILRMPKVQNS